MPSLVFGSVLCPFGERKELSCATLSNPRVRDETLPNRVSTVGESVLAFESAAGTDDGGAEMSSSSCGKSGGSSVSS